MTALSLKNPALAHDARLDFVRVVSCFAVVLLHVSARPIYMQSELSPWGWLLGNAVSSLTHWCVPVFVMLSAVLILGNVKTTYQVMLSSRIPRMLGVLAVSTLIYGLWMKLFQGSFVWDAFLRSLILGQPYYHLHFFYLIIGLYFIAPALSRVVVDMPEVELRNVVIVTCMLTMIVFAWSSFSRTYTPNGATFSWWYISYYLLGYYLYRYKPALPYAWILIGGYVVTVGGTQALAYTMGNNYIWKLYFYSYFSPTVFAMAIGVWGMALKYSHMVNARFIRAAAPLTLLVYILHPMVMECLRSQYGKISPELMRPVVEVPMTVVLTFAVSLAAAWLLRKINFVKKYF
ncbi:acyltransferase [Pseudomonas sp. NPDC089422]|uniref:acyltransferase n=1 Tax=Pseudomonas sp. NPDC089422 TaxID=3364466 RepID=UPI0038273B34